MTTTARDCPDLDSQPHLDAQLPPMILAGLRRYALHHEPVGGFLTAVLANDFVQAVARADEDSLRAILPIARYVVWCLPSKCHGSAEKVQAWLAAARAIDGQAPR